MQPDGPTLPTTELRRLHHGLASAPDAQIAKVVATVDALEARGIADDVIAPLRARLPQLRLPRPLRLSRLLFLPLDALIVPTPFWREDAPTIPRSAVLPLADIVRAGMGREAAAIDAAIQGRVVADCKTVRDAGRILWPAAAHILAEVRQPPAAWTKAHLPPECFAALTRRIATLIGQTEILDPLFAATDIGVSLQPESLIPLVAISVEDAGTLTMLVALVLARLPEARPLLISAARAVGPRYEAPMSAAIDRALEVLVDRLETGSSIETLVIGSSLGQAAAEVRRIYELLDGLLKNRLYDDWPSRLVTMMRRIDASCRLRFAIALDVEFAGALQVLGGVAKQTALIRLEEVAGHLRNLEQEARRIGSRDCYDALLGQAATQVKAMPLDRGFGLMDRVRLVEILAGSDEALALLEAADTAEA